ncbi:hypothetical protein ACX80S_03230 [Arthrobacter sp. RHLT1-20]
MELLNTTPVFLWRAVCFFAVAAVVAGILLPGTPAVSIVLIIITLLLTGWAVLVQRHVRRRMVRK